MNQKIEPETVGGKKLVFDEEKRVIGNKMNTEKELGNGGKESIINEKEREQVAEGRASEKSDHKKEGSEIRSDSKEHNSEKFVTHGTFKRKRKSKWEIPESSFIYRAKEEKP
jgi:hypothetical protein